MIFEPRQLSDFDAIAFDAVIIGSGPVGLITALRLESKGHNVLILESGGRRADPVVQSLSEAYITHPEYHTAETLNALADGAIGSDIFAVFVNFLFLHDESCEGFVGAAVGVAGDGDNGLIGTANCCPIADFAEVNFTNLLNG